MRTVSIGRIALVMLALVALTSCSLVSPGNAGRPDIRGTVTQITPALAQSGETNIIGTILIEGAKETDTQFDRAMVTATDKTVVLEQIGEPRRPAKFENIRVGDRVEAQFTGPVRESYPVQATASAITILR